MPQPFDEGMTVSQHQVVGRATLCCAGNSDDAVRQEGCSCLPRHPCCHCFIT
jgi:hypothetical protein